MMPANWDKADIDGLHRNTRDILVEFTRIPEASEVQGLVPSGIR
jgi:hypothetical protein